MKIKSENDDIEQNLDKFELKQYKLCHENLSRKAKKKIKNKIRKKTKKAAIK